MSNQWDIENVKIRGYRSGSILRIRMRNFLIYDDALVYPGPRLNIVLGPNGTGKSALTHAICLACGGKPSSVGRSDDLKEFVKRSTEKHVLSFCEVDLLRNDSVITIRRTLNDETQGSKWTIDGKVSTQKQVKQIMSEMNIDVDNLCSFMPQDKVGSFTQQSAKGILHKTLECIKVSGDKNLHEEQMELAQEQNCTRDRGREVEMQQSAVDTLRNQLNGMKSEVERIQQRVAVEQRLKLFEIKLLVIALQECEKACKAKQELADAAMKELASKKADIQPLEGRVRALQKQQAVFEKTIKASADKKLRSDQELQAFVSTMNDCDVQVETRKADVASVAGTRATLEHRLRATVNELQRFQKQYEEASSRLPAVKQQLQAAATELDDFKRRKDDNSDTVDQLLLSQREPRMHIERAQKGLENLKDFRQMFCSRLKGRDTDVVKARQWIDSNRSRLQGECYGPVGMEIQMKEVFAAHVLESAVGTAKLLTIVCETKADEVLLNRELRDQRRLNVNIVTMHHRDQFHCPYSPELLQSCGRWGMKGPISDLYVMPDLVRLYLNNFTTFHAILWAHTVSSLITPSSLNELCSAQQKFFRVFVVDMTVNTDGSTNKINEIVEFSGSVSRYRPNEPPSIKQQNVRPANLVRSGVDSDNADEKETLQRTIAGNRDIVHNIDTKIEHLRKDSSQCNDEISALTVKIRELRGALKGPETLQRTIDREKSKKAELESLLTVGIEQEKQVAKAKLTQAVQGLIAAVGDTQRAADASVQAGLEKLHVSITCRGSGRDLEEAVEELEDAKRTLACIEQRIVQCQRERDECRRKNMEAEQALLRTQEEVGGEEALNKLYKESIPLTAHLSKDELEMKVQEVKGQLDATIDNPQLIKRFQDTKDSLEEAESRLQVLTEKYSLAESTLNERLSHWRNAVQAIASKLNRRFERFMEELQYSGNVEFEQIGSLSEYQMQMHVSFRENRLMQKLDGQSHSGGERAVSTVMYLMALQELTSSPFRVVDEINQGMDERNERLVFDRIVRSCCTRPCNIRTGCRRLINGGSASSSSVAQNVWSAEPSEGESTPSGLASSRVVLPADRAQYFLVSPKLLEGLAAIDNDDVTVLMVYNGPGITSKWQLGDIITALKKRKAMLISSSST